MTPQEAQAQLEQTKGSALTPEEINAAVQMLQQGGWQQGGDISGDLFRNLYDAGIKSWGAQGLLNKDIGPNTVNNPNIYEGTRTPPGPTGTTPTQGPTPTPTPPPTPPPGGTTTVTPPVDLPGPVGPSAPPVVGPPGSLAPPTPTLPTVPTVSPYQPSKFTPKPYEYTPFNAPSKEDALNDPGYQFRTQQGEQALQQSAAGKGVLRTGGTLKDLINYGQNAASAEYQNVYNRSLGTWQQNEGAKLAAALGQGNLELGAFNANENAGLGAWNANTGQTNTGFSLQQQNSALNYAPALLGYQTGISQANTNADRETSASQTDYQNQWNQYLQRFIQSQWNQQFPWQVLSGMANSGQTSAGQ